MTKTLHPTSWRFRHRRAGKVIWASDIGELDVAIASGDFEALLREQPYKPNALADEGESAMLDTYFRGATQETNFYIGLVNDTPVDTDTLATLTGEPSGNGYARQAVPASSSGFPTLALDTGDFQTTTTTETFTASGGTIGPVTYAFLCNVVSGTVGKLIVYNALSTTRTLTDGDSLDVDIAIKLA